MRLPRHYRVLIRATALRGAWVIERADGWRLYAGRARVEPCQDDWRLCAPGGWFDPAEAIRWVALRQAIAVLEETAPYRPAPASPARAAPPPPPSTSGAPPVASAFARLAA